MKSFKNDGTFVIFSFSWPAADAIKSKCHHNTDDDAAITVVMTTITMKKLFS